MSSAWRNIQDESDEEDDFRTEADRESLVFVVDASIAMLDPAPASVAGLGDAPSASKRSYLDLAIDCAQAVLRSRIVSAPSDKQAVVFFNTREKRGVDDALNGAGGRDGVYVAQRMDVPSARRIQDLADLLGRRGRETFAREIGSAPENGPENETAPDRHYDALLKAHHAAREMLCDHGPGARVSKKVLLFTNRDDPLAPGEDGRELVAQWREYRNVHGIDVVLLPLPRTTTTTTTTLREGGEGGGGGDDDDDDAGGGGRREFAEFDPSTFYRRLLTCAGDEPPPSAALSQPPSSTAATATATATATALTTTTTTTRGHELVTCASDRMQSLAVSLAKKSRRRRKVRSATLRFGAGDGEGIAVALYAPAAEAKKPKAIQVHSRDLTELHAETVYLSVLHGDEVARAEASKKCVEYGDAAVALTPKDLSDAKRACGAEGIHLFGFRDRDVLERWMQLSRPARLMVPEEETTQAGATAAFTALVGAMAEKGKIALAAYARTDDRSAGVRCVALAPAHARGELVGLHVVSLPYLDDVRHPERAHATRGASGGGGGGDDDDDDAAEGAAGATRLQIAAAERAVEANMVLAYDPLDIPNPTLARHYRALELQALDKPWDAETEKGLDKTTPPDAAALLEIDGMADDMRAFKDAVYGPRHDEEVAALGGGPGGASGARRGGGAGGGTKRKAAAIGGGLLAAAAGLAATDVKGLAERGELETLTAALLKEYCAANGLSVGGVKAVLAARVREHALA